MGTVRESLFGAVKLISFVGSALVAALMISSSMRLDMDMFTPKDPTVIAKVPVQYTTFPDVGKVYTPHIDVAIVTPKKTVPTTFLIDSGAKISALPLRYIQELGIDTSTAKRIYLRSATNNTTYGYLSTITLKFDDSATVTIPVTFAEIIEPLLGTYGFFDKHTLIFDPQEDTITIKGNI